MTGRKGLFAIATALALAFSVSIPAFASELPAEVGHSYGAGEQAIILHTNDTHAAIKNFSKLAAYRQQLINEGYDVATVDAGDAIQGQLIGVLTEGAAIADLMNTVPYDIAVPGNHEFDYGMDAFLDLAKDKEKYPSYKYVSCNFMDLKTNAPVFDPYEIMTLKGHKVAFVGVSTPETYTKSTPIYFQDDDGNYIYSFSENNFYACVQDAVDKAKSAGAEVVIAVAHLGIDGSTEEWSSESLIANTTGIDAIIDGHDHQTYEDKLTSKDGKQVVHAETGYSFANIGKLTLTFGADGVSISGELVKPDSVTVNASSAQNVRDIYGAVQKKIDDYNAEIAYLEEQIGTSEVDLETMDSDGQWIARYEETALGDYVADAYRGVLESDIAFVNGGGVRSSGIKAGEVSRKTMLDVNPWGNEMGVIRVTGRQITDFLEFCSRADWNDEAGHLAPAGTFNQVSGLTYEIDMSAGPSPVIADDKGVFQSFDPSKNRRIKNVKVAGKDIDPNASYTLGGSMYVLRDSAEGNSFFGGAEVVKESDLTDGDILVAYMTDDLPNNTITAAEYGKPQGRIVVSAPKAAADPGESVVPQTGDDFTSIALLVIRGNYDNGAKRVTLLTEAGYDARAVQKRVNEILRAKKAS